MSSKHLLALIFFTVVSFARAQTVLWADKVLEVSSEHTDQFYSPKNRAIQILGTPSVYPQMVPSPAAWQPNGSDFGEDYIKVGFEKAIRVLQVAIIENVNPGAVARIFGYDEENNEYLMYQSTGNATNSSKRFWRVFPEEVPEKPLNAIKLVINHRISKGEKQIDAIAISDATEFINFDINIADDVPKNLQKENLGMVVNSPYGEVAPIITPDGNTLYFTRLEHPDNIKMDGEDAIAQDIWYSKLDPLGKWTVPNNIGPPINNELDNAAATASADGNSLYILNVYHPSGKLLAGLSKTTFTPDGWSIPEKVEIDNFHAMGQKNPKTEKTEVKTEYAISYDESILIMGLQRSQTFGGKDLYVSFKKPDGSFSLPLNLGPIINTADDEGSPFLSADKKTLYFNSAGHPGYGDADIFVTRRLDDTWKNWSKPLNLGSKINSSKWDGYFSIPASGDFAFMSSRDNSFGEEDIFKIKLFESIKPESMTIIRGRITDISNNKPIDLPISITGKNDSSSNYLVDIERDLEKGTYKAILPVGYRYTIDLSGTGFLSIEDSINLLQSLESSEIIRDYELTPIREGHRMILQNLFFDQGKYEIKEDSYAELQRIIKIMTEYPTMRVLLEGYTDNQGNFTLNVKLAENRVNAVRDYLVKEGGINRSRIETKSWGPMNPISSNSTPETRKKNRRVEFTILKL